MANQHAKSQENSEFSSNLDGTRYLIALPSSLDTIKESHSQVVKRKQFYTEESRF